MVELEFPILLNSIHSLQKEVSVDIGEVNPGLMQGRRRCNKGKYPKLNSRDERKIIREIARRWEHFGDTFTVRRVKYASRLTYVSERAVHTAPNATKEQLQGKIVENVKYLPTRSQIHWGQVSGQIVLVSILMG